jgi:hypothetical protein
MVKKIHFFILYVFKASLLHMQVNFIISSATSQSQSHITTDGQSVSQSWCRAPSGPHVRIFIAV